MFRQPLEDTKMNGIRAHICALGALTASLATTPAALAWPTCSHSAATGDDTFRSEAVLQKAIREHLMLRHDFATGLRSSEGDTGGMDQRNANSDDAPPRIREGLVLPEQPRWRM
jgi:hypothetical protein